MTALIESRANPFGDAASRTRYFESDAHYRRAAADLRALFARRSGLIFITADPAPDGARLKARLVEGAPMRAGLARAEPSISFYDLMQRYANDLGVGDDGRGYWSVQERLGADARAGIASVLLIEGADALDDYVFDQLDRFAKDAPQAPLPVLLLGSSRLPQRDGLGFLASSVVGRVAFTRPTSDEIPGYLRWRLTQAGLPNDALSDAVLAEIAVEARDDLASADRLAAEALVRARAAELPDDPVRVDAFRGNCASCIRACRAGNGPSAWAVGLDIGGPTSCPLRTFERAFVAGRGASRLETARGGGLRRGRRPRRNGHRPRRTARAPGRAAPGGRCGGAYAGSDGLGRLKAGPPNGARRRAAAGAAAERDDADACGCAQRLERPNPAGRSSAGRQSRV